MLRLMLLRHARAEPANGFADFDRPLIARGRSGIRAVAAFMAENGLRPDLALVSPARRAAETWDITAASLPDSRPVRHDGLLYGASEKTLLAVIRQVAAGYRSVLLVGHNPGLEQLAKALAGGGNGDNLQRLREQHVPAGALAVIDFEADSWKRISAQNGCLAIYVTPADLDREGE